MMPSFSGVRLPGAASEPDPQPHRLVVRAEELKFEYPDGLLAVDKLSFEVHEGEVLAIVGPSGCGKSTLLGLLAGIHTPTDGLVAWNDELAAEIEKKGRRPKRRRLTLVFQRDTLLPWKTVEGNVAFGLRYVSLTRNEREDRITSLLRLAKMEEFRTAYPNKLSGGMRRRVALLTGIAPLPRLLLLDEPFAALDEPTRVAVHADLLEIVYRLGLTVILVTHDLAEAITLSDRVLITTARPARLATIVETGFGHQRDVRTVRELPEYQGLYAQTWHELWKQTETPATPTGRTP